MKDKRKKKKLLFSYMKSFWPLDYDVGVYVYANDVIQYLSTGRCEVPQVG